MTKLYPILFTEQQQQLKLLSPEQMKAPPSAFNHIPPGQLKTPARFAPPAYAMIQFHDEGTYLAMINVDMFKRWIDSGRNRETFPVESWLCAYCGTSEEHPSNECSGAVEINYMVASPKYPGAGGAMYAFMSKLFGKPITSDRHTSTSNSAKKAWARIEQSGDWKQVPLDNFTEPDYSNRKKTYFDDEGHWPSRTITKLPGAKTRKRSDDCSLPREADSNSDSVNGTLGSADAWLYTGALDPQPLLDNFESAAEGTHVSAPAAKNYVRNNCQGLFSKFYKGVSG